MEKLFRFDGSKNVRIAEKDGALLFAPADVCRVIGIKNVDQAVSRVLKHQKILHTWGTAGGVQQGITITEGGLYVMILRSRAALEEGTIANRFLFWVTDEVLPSIRKTGAYIDVNRLVDDTLGLDNKTAYALMREAVEKKIEEVKIEFTHRVAALRAATREAWDKRDAFRYGQRYT